MFEPLCITEEPVQGIKERLAELLFGVAMLLRKVVDPVALCFVKVAAETIGWL